MLDIRPEVVKPSESATLATPLEPWREVEINSTNQPQGLFIQKEKGKIQPQGSKHILICWLEENYRRIAQLTGFMRESNPVTMGAILVNVLLQLCIFVWRPWPLLHIGLVAARCPPHLCLDSDREPFLLPVSVCLMENLWGPDRLYIKHLPGELAGLSWGPLLHCWADNDTQVFIYLLVM